MFDAEPALHGRVQSVADDGLVGFQRLDQAGFARAVVADEGCERAKLDHPAIDDGLEVADADALQLGGLIHWIRPLSTSR